MVQGSSEPGGTRTVLVIGGGAAGMMAAATLSDLGLEVHLVERAERLGGHLAQLARLFPDMSGGGDLLGRLMNDLRGRAGVVIHLGSEVSGIERARDSFLVTIGDGERNGKRTLEAGAVILATGMEAVDAAEIPELGYGRLKDVVTSLEFEAMLDPNGPSGGRLRRPSDGGDARHIVFVQCVGSRVERRGVPYCSSVCCAASVKNALEVKERCPECEVHVLYIDVRLQGRGQERMYKEARRRGVKFVRGQPSMVVRDRKTGRLVVQGENTLLRELYEIPADLVVLAVGLREPASNAPLFERLGVRLDDEGLPATLPEDQDGVTAAPGVFLAGCAESPKDIKDSLLQAQAAAAKAAALLRRGAAPKA